MNGVLVVDKPVGPTSHDVVSRVRRLLGERRIGHTGTLDPAASGVLPLVLGKATRLARFMSASDKSYAAVVRLGFATDSQDAEGTPIGVGYTGPWPEREAIERALDAFRGTTIQQPPAFSAKKVGGERSYVSARRARRNRAAESASVAAAAVALPTAVPVTVTALDLVAVEGPLITLTVDCSAGFYVRTLADDIGRALGTGAHLAALRRVRSGDITLDQAVALAVLEQDAASAANAVIPLAQMLPALPSVRLTPDGVRRAAHGRDLGPADVLAADIDRASGRMPDRSPYVRLLDPAGDLVAIAASRGASGLLHPAVVVV
jgi:tRNA pseudouridine55 synthase